MLRHLNTLLAVDYPIEVWGILMNLWQTDMFDDEY